MAFIPTPNTVKVCMRYNQNGQTACNVFNVDLGVEPTSALMTTLAQVIKLWYDDNLRDLIHNGTSLQQIELYDISSEDDDGLIFTTGLPSTGTVSGDPLPNNVSVVTKLASGFTGRSRRGRKFFIGMSESQLAVGRQTVTPTFQAAISTAWNELIIALVAEGWKLVITSFINNGVPRAEGLNTEVTNALTNIVLDSMRRRLPGRGE